MGRKYLDCREYPSDKNCSVVISADSDTELFEVALQHGILAHGHKDTPHLREALKGAIKDGRPTT